MPLTISWMPPRTACPCTVTDPKSATASGFAPVCCFSVPEIVVLAVPVVCTFTSAANEVAFPACWAACRMAPAALTDPPPPEPAVAPVPDDALAPGSPWPQTTLLAEPAACPAAEHPATASAPAVTAMAPQQAFRDVPRCCGIMRNLQACVTFRRVSNVAAPSIPGASISNNLARPRAERPGRPGEPGAITLEQHGP